MVNAKQHAENQRLGRRLQDLAGTGGLARWITDDERREWEAHLRGHRIPIPPGLTHARFRLMVEQGAAAEAISWFKRLEERRAVMETAE